MTEQHPEPGGDGAARAAQVAATALTIAEGLIRLRSQRAANRADAEQHQAAVTRATQENRDEGAGLLSCEPQGDRWLRRESGVVPGIPLARPAGEGLHLDDPGGSRWPPAMATPDHRGQRPIRVIVGESYPVPIGETVAAASARPRVTSAAPPTRATRTAALRR